MPPRVRKLLLDVVDACDAIERFAGQLSLAAYRADERTKAAVERKLLVVGEAISRMDREHTLWAAKLNSTRQIKAFRNIVVHEYERIDDEIVWGVVTKYISLLRTEVRLLLQAYPEV